MIDPTGQRVTDDSGEERRMTADSTTAMGPIESWVREHSRDWGIADFDKLPNPTLLPYLREQDRAIAALRVALEKIRDRCGIDPTNLAPKMFAGEIAAMATMALYDPALTATQGRRREEGEG